jgi:hypothetical protein
LDVALLGNRGLFDRDHLALHIRKLRCRLFVTADEERRRPNKRPSIIACPASADAPIRRAGPNAD